MIEPGQRCLKRILWRLDDRVEMACYGLNTVTYGTATTPYVATYCLDQIAVEIQGKNPCLQVLQGNIRKWTKFCRVWKGLMNSYSRRVNCYQ